MSARSSDFRGDTPASCGSISFIAPGATLGVIGGGQLGRMFVQAAQQMGYSTRVLDPDPASPAGQVAHAQIRAGYLDPDALDRLGREAAAVTTEFENVPAAALERLAAVVRVAPGAAAVAICQDRLAEKAALARCGIACAPHAGVADTEQARHVDPALFPGILKTNRLGYDGKGQAAVERAGDIEAVWESLGRTACVLERQLDLAHEISVIVARSANGAVVHFPVQHNLHRAGILALTRVPAGAVSADLQQRAIEAACRVAEALDYVGVLCVEFFVLRDGSLVANEMAPRPHNSGHYSIDACDVSQFDLQVRAMCGAPLVAPRLHSPCVMLNLLGDLWLRGEGGPREPDWASVLALPGVHLHLYGKSEPRRGRKMGHLTVTAPSADQAETVARQAAACLGLERYF